jgi:hypothetical protein
MAEGEGVEPSTHEVGPVFETGCAPPRTTFRFYEHSTNWSGWLDSNQRPPASEAGTLAGLSYTLSEHDPEKPAPDLIRGGNRFSEKIMLKSLETGAP